MSDPVVAGGSEWAREWRALLLEMLGDLKAQVQRMDAGYDESMREIQRDIMKLTDDLRTHTDSRFDRLKQRVDGNALDLREVMARARWEGRVAGVVWGGIIALLVSVLSHLFGG